jgi:hypothetical protein
MNVLKVNLILIITFYLNSNYLTLINYSSLKMSLLNVSLMSTLNLKSHLNYLFHLMGFLSMFHYLIPMILKITLYLLNVMYHDLF